jgi:hypothetical protein
MLNTIPCYPNTVLFAAGRCIALIPDPPGCQKGRSRTFTDLKARMELDEGALGDNKGRGIEVYDKREAATAAARFEMRSAEWAGDASNKRARRD